MKHIKKILRIRVHMQKHLLFQLLTTKLNNYEKVCSIVYYSY